MPPRGDRKLRRSDESLSQVLMRLVEDARGARDRRRPRATRPPGHLVEAWQRGKRPVGAARRPRPRVLSEQVAREQYVAPTRAQRVALSE
jgi:hypothetical protein